MVDFLNSNDQNLIGHQQYPVQLESVNLNTSLELWCINIYLNTYSKITAIKMFKTSLQYIPYH